MEYDTTKADRLGERAWTVGFLFFLKIGVMLCPQV